MCAVENLCRICRYHPRQSSLMKAEVLAYDRASIRLESFKDPPYLSYNTACVVLRGLAEFMTMNNWWYEANVDVFVEDKLVGNALLWNPDGRLASTDTT